MSTPDGIGRWSTIQWGAIITALGMLAGIFGYWVNVHITVNQAVSDIGDMRTNAFRLMSELQKQVEGNRQVVAATEQRMIQVQHYVDRLVELADERTELLQDALSKIDPSGIGRQFERLRLRQRQIIDEGRGR